MPSLDNGVASPPDSAATFLVKGTSIVRAKSIKEEDCSPEVVHSYIFRGDTLQQESPQGSPDHIDFEFDPATRNGDASPALKDVFLNVPTVSLVFEFDDLFGPEGIYVNSEESGDAWQRRCSFEWIPPDKERSRQVFCEGRIQGAASRSQSKKQNFRLNFIKEYGPGEFKGRVFETTEIKKFDSLVLRNPTHDSWAVGIESLRNQARYVNDSWAAETQRAMGHLSPHRRWVNLYLNGYYWGIYTLTERPDEDFLASHLGGEKDDYDVVNSNSLRHGTMDRLEHLRNLVANPRIRSRGTYEEIEAQLHIDGLIDYFLFNVYMCNIDWPSKNYWLGGGRTGSPKFRFLNWDAEVGFFETWESFRNPTQCSALTYDILRSKIVQQDKTGAGYFIRALLGNPEFRLRFADRVHMHTRPGGPLSPDGASSRYRALLTEVEPLLLLEASRWGDAFGGTPYGPETVRWSELTGENSWLFSEFFPNRTRHFVEMLRSTRFYRALDPPTILKDLLPDGGFRVALASSIPEGKIYYTVNGKDPREKWTNSPSGNLYQKTLVIPADATISARVKKGTAWSALVDTASLEVREPVSISGK